MEYTSRSSASPTSVNAAGMTVAASFKGPRGTSEVKDMEAALEKVKDKPYYAKPTGLLAGTSTSTLAYHCVLPTNVRPLHQDLCNNATSEVSMASSDASHSDASDDKWEAMDADAEQPSFISKGKAVLTFPALSVSQFITGTSTTTTTTNIKKRTLSIETQDEEPPREKRVCVSHASSNSTAKAIVSPGQAKAVMGASLGASLPSVSQDLPQKAPPTKSIDAPMVSTVALQQQVWYAPPQSGGRTSNFAPIMPKPSPAAVGTHDQSHHEPPKVQLPMSAYHQAVLPHPPLDHANHQERISLPTATLAVAAPAAIAPRPLSVDVVPSLQNSILHKSVLPNTTIAAVPHEHYYGRVAPAAPQVAASQLLLAPRPPAPVKDDVVSTRVRNQTMQATDCLLFAASLLQEKAPSSSAVHTRTASASSSSDSSSASLAAAYSQSQQQQQQMPLIVPQQGRAPLAQQHSGVAGLLPQSAPKLLPLSGYGPQEASHSREEPRELDVLCGRGGLINKHVGNIIYRRVVEHNKTFYQSVPKRHRILVSQSIVHTILNRGGRFLSEDTKTSANADGTISTVTLWKNVATPRAIQKTSQALRERLSAVTVAPKTATLRHEKGVSGNTMLTARAAV